MGSAETSKDMFPCWCREHLHKPVSFKMILEKFLTNHKNDAKDDPKTIEKSI